MAELDPQIRVRPGLGARVVIEVPVAVAPRPAQAERDAAVVEPCGGRWFNVPKSTGM
jgi:hypothetical protein